MNSRSVDLFGPVRNWAEIVLGDETLIVERARLGLHLLLGEQREAFTAAIEAWDSTGVSQAFIEYLSLSTGKPIAEIRSLSFVECGNAIDVLWELNTIRHIPPFLANETPDRAPVPWDYPRRNLLTWIHIIAHAYHWSRKEILELVPEEALAVVQEILVEQQLNREWQWLMSDNCQVYEPGAKKPRFKPLPRPRWMVEKVQEPKEKPRIPQSMLPVGNVISLGEGAPGATQVIQPPEKFAPRD